MSRDETYMQRCLELAENGLGAVAPNPMVGCVIVHQDQIIGEGFHQQFGQAHAEVNAIESVEQKHLLEKATLYVNLEPCSHHGKTPPCSDLVVKHNIPQVVIGTTDPFPSVSGSGIDLLKKAGVSVKNNVLSTSCRWLNRRFFTFHEKKRPYIFLKWAQTADGYMGIERNSHQPKKITNRISDHLVHRWRSEEQSIFVGTQTALEDNPALTTRLVDGKNPIRLVLDKDLRLPQGHQLFNKESQTLVFTAQSKASENHVEFHPIDFSGNVLHQVLEHLYKKQILSVIVEGGKQLLDSFIQSNLWDEAMVFSSPKRFGSGVKAPDFNLSNASIEEIGNDQLFHKINSFR